MQSVTFVSHAGQQITVIDFRGCEPGTFGPVIQQAEQVICMQPPGSVRALTVFDEDVRFDMGTVKEMQRFVSRAMPHLRANALVGIDGMKKVVFNGIKALYKSPVELFGDVDSAKAWVAAR